MDTMLRKDGSSRRDGVNNNTYELLFKDFIDLPIEEWGSYKNEVAINTISEFTKNQEKNIFGNLLRNFYQNKYKIDSDKIIFNEETKQYEYRDNNTVITFDKISNYFDDRKIKKELTTDDRRHKCHVRSIAIAPSIENSRVVTGYITIGNNRYLHSVIEYDVENETVVLDWTKNIKISKEQYIELMNFVELSSFEGKNVLKDLEMLSENIELGVKTYAVFRDELMRDIQKNQQLFEKKKR